MDFWRQRWPLAILMASDRHYPHLGANFVGRPSVGVEVSTACPGRTEELW
jgi:hypothetical protein